jgi:hypothetical protein
MSIGRRDVIRSLASMAVLPWLDGVDLFRLGSVVHAQSASSKDAPLRVLDEPLNRLVTAASECIIPSTDTPGAALAGVTRFIDHMLADWYPADRRDRFLKGLTELDARARATHSTSFAECSAPDQTRVLSTFDDEVAKLRSAGSAAGATAAIGDDHWFAMLKFLTVWGYYTSEIGERQELQRLTLPMRYDGCAPYTPRVRRDSQP